MHVRTATHEDLESVTTVHRNAVDGVETDAYDAEQLDAWNHDRDPGDYPVDDDEYAVVVAVRDGDVVGFGQLHDRSGEVVAVYVDPDHARRGVGTALLSHLEGRAAAYGHRSVEVLASKNAVGFYERRGYTPTGTQTVEPADGVALDCVRMETRVRTTPGVDDWGRLPA